jgi:ComF family protein
MVPPPFVRAVSAGVYEGSMRSAIHALKYDSIGAAARQLGRLLATAVEPISEDVPQGMLVVPVPLHGKRMKQRGFNQARRLASEAISVLARRHPLWKLELSARTLVRQRSTQSQAGLSPHKRRQNLRGAFFVSDVAGVQGRHILLVDDIFTTGATARACSRMLMEAGAASVYVATLARAQRRVPFPFRDETQFVRLAVPKEFQSSVASHFQPSPS